MIDLEQNHSLRRMFAFASVNPRMDEDEATANVS